MGTYIFHTLFDILLIKRLDDEESSICTTQHQVNQSHGSMTARQRPCYDGDQGMDETSSTNHLDVQSPDVVIFRSLCHDEPNPDVLCSYRTSTEAGHHRIPDGMKDLSAGSENAGS